MPTWTTASADETIERGRLIAKSLRPGSVVALEGDLGSGKTTFLKGLAMGLGLRNPDEVKSPTFVLMHLYEAQVPIYHFDLYRLNGIKDLEAIGFEEFIHDRRAVVCIEWAEKAKPLLPSSTLFVHFRVMGEKLRLISIQDRKA